MEHWDPAFVSGGQIEVEFGGSGLGLIRLGCVYGKINCWSASRDGDPAMEWCWEDQSETMVGQSQGWAVLKSGQLHGMIMLLGGDTSFVAEKVRSVRPPESRNEGELPDS